MSKFNTSKVMPKLQTSLQRENFPFLWKSSGGIQGAVPPMLVVVTPMVFLTTRERPKSVRQGIPASLTSMFP